MNDDLITLASAYLDGETTAAERAQVEVDPELLAQVERLRRVRAVVGDLDTAPISMRERHLAGALDAWDRLPTEQFGDATPTGSDAAGAAGGASITAPTPLRSRRTRRSPISSRVLTAAAAVVVLAGVGLVVRSALDAGGEDSDSAAVVADVDAGNDAATSAEFEAGPVAAAEETFAEDAPADDLAVAAVPAPASEAVQGGPEEPPGNDDLELLSGNAELAEFANRKVISRTIGVDTESSSDDTAPDTTLEPPVDLCGLIDEFVGFALWDAPGLFDEAIAVGIDNRTGQAVAYQDASCTLIARTPLP